MISNTALALNYVLRLSFDGLITRTAYTKGDKVSMIDRYSRQTLFPGIGQEGQRKLGNSCVVVIGCGALGTIIATSLVRAGVGKVRIIDRDFIEYHNLQRQVLFNEEDIKAELPKAIAAERHLKKVNSSVEIEGVVSDANYTNIERLVAGADLILDGLDNLEARFLINDVSWCRLPSLSRRIPVSRGEIWYQNYFSLRAKCGTGLKSRGKGGLL